MKRLIRKAENNYDYDQSQTQDEYDNYLGQYVEVIYNKSKWFGFTGYVDNKMHAGERYVIYLEPKNYEQVTAPHRIYVKKYEAYKWLNIVQLQEDQGQ